MPTYEYRCQDCRHELEAQQAFTDDALTECPSCGGLLKKKFSSVGISFKGSGFYKTDSRSSSKSKSSTNGSGSSESSDKADTSSSTSSSDSTKASDSGSTASDAKATASTAS